MLQGLFLLLLGGCSHGTANPPEVSPLSWEVAAAEQEARDLLIELSRIDTSSPGGRTDAAARVVQSFLSRHDVEAEILALSSGQACVFARLEASVSRAKAPILLVGALDTQPTDPVFWPSDTPPTGGVVKDGVLWGQGVLSGKAATALYTVAVAVLRRQQHPIERDVIFVALPDGATGGRAGLDTVLARYPEVTTASIALSAGGMGVRELVTSEQTVHLVSRGEKGFVKLRIAALAGRGTSPPLPSHSRTGAQAHASASERLARALDRILAEPERPKITPIGRPLLEAAAEHASFPKALVLRSPMLANILALRPLLTNNEAIRPFFVDDVRIVEMAGGRSGSVSEPQRVRATVFVSLLPGSTPSDQLARMRHLIGDPNVHVTIEDGAEAIESPRSSGLETLLQEVLPIEDEGGTKPNQMPNQIVVYGSALPPTAARHLIQLGVRTYGILPFVVERETFVDARFRAERVSLENLRRATQKTVRIVAALSR